MKRVRTIFQLFFLIAAIITGFRYAMGWSRTTIETYCPFGGLETRLPPRRITSHRDDVVHVRLFRLGQVPPQLIRRRSHAGEVGGGGYPDFLFQSSDDIQRPFLRRPAGPVRARHEVGAEFEQLLNVVKQRLFAPRRLRGKQFEGEAEFTGPVSISQGHQTL